jgi:CBS domain containing-hemolysin-like protein
MNALARLGALRPDDFAVVAVCLLVAAVFSAAETSLFALVDARVHELIDDAKRAKRRLRALLQLWVDKPDHVLTAIVLGKHAAHVGFAVAIFVRADDLAEGVLKKPLWAALTGLGVVATIVVVELFARAVSKHRAEVTAPLVFPLVLVVYVATWPLVLLFTRLSRLFTRLGGGNVSRSGPFVTERDIREMIALGRRTGALDKTEGRMLTSIIELDATLVRELMIPRADISSLPLGSTFDEVMAEVRDKGHSRLPVYDGTIDDVRGFFHTKDLLAGDVDAGTFRLRDHLRPVEFVPELMKVGDLLRLLQRKKTHLAIVVDEFGGTAGLVALEDVLEEIVGPIHDEHDEEEAALKKLSDTRFVAEGRIALYDLGEALGLTFPDGGYETLGGFLIARCGRMPRKGDRVAYHGYSFVVADADERKVSRIEIDRTLSTVETSEPQAISPASVEPTASPGLERDTDDER